MMKIKKVIHSWLEILSYFIYAKVYNMRDDQIEYIEISLSEADNNWNIEALQSKEERSKLGEGDASLHITARDNSWNKDALGIKEPSGRSSSV